MSVQRWKAFVVDVYPRGLSRETALRARDIHKETLDHLEWLEEDAAERAHLRRGISLQVRLAARYRSALLIQELERFAIEKPPARVPKDLWRLADLFDSIQSRSNVITELYSVVSLAEQEQPTYPNGPGQGKPRPPKPYEVEILRERRNRYIDRIQKLYDSALALKKDAHMRFDKLKAETKADTPVALHRFIDLVVDLFVYERIEALILYLRRHHPGPIGAFHGLPERGGRR